MIADPSTDPILMSRVRALSHSVAVTGTEADQLDTALHPAPAIVLLRVTDTSELPDLPRSIKEIVSSPILLMVDAADIQSAGSFTAWDDFVVLPATDGELEARVARLVSVSPISGNRILRGDLAIDIDSCEVSLGGRLIELTYKEYELLRFLAANPGRVHSRETLLDRVWGYDYYGGDRTVDVHVRRLRSKIEDANHTYIDTVRNMGYRFRKEGPSAP